MPGHWEASIIGGPQGSPGYRDAEIASLRMVLDMIVKPARFFHDHWKTEAMICTPAEHHSEITALAAAIAAYDSLTVAK